MKLRSISLPVSGVLLVLVLVSWAAHSPSEDPLDTRNTPQPPDVSGIVAQVNTALAEHWESVPVSPAGPADDLTIFRRLSLALHGTIPSLEEIRLFQEDARPDRLAHWTAMRLADDRFANYFAERLARAFVGIEQGQFIVYRRDRFTRWLSEGLQQNRPYNELVREMITGEGLWTDSPESNFATSTVIDGRFDEEKLAGRSVRAFLGQRIDCAQCHNHPFDHWKQSEFRGLAAYFGQLGLTPVGVHDRPSQDYTVPTVDNDGSEVVAPAVPFHPEWLPTDGSRREKLATWITHPENSRFSRAIANRVWGLMLGQPFHTPVDDLPDPDVSLPVLDLLAEDFAENDYNLRRLIHAIAATQAFRISSRYTSDDARDLAAAEQSWAVFPLTRLRPEQVIGSMLQATSLKTIDQNSHLLVRARRFFQERDFVDEYGDPGADELTEQTGTVPQALLRMNGRFSAESSRSTPFSAAGRVAGLSPDENSCLEACYLVCLTRLPSQDEREHFLPLLHAAKKRGRQRIVEDVFWALYNSPEFSWNH